MSSKLAEPEGEKEEHTVISFWTTMTTSLKETISLLINLSPKLYWRSMKNSRKIRGQEVSREKLSQPKNSKLIW